MQDHKFNTIQDARAFALAGNAILTLQSNKTGAHYTYKIQAPKKETERGGLVTDFDSDKRFVKLLSFGNADDGTWTYLGLVRNGQFFVTKNSALHVDAPSVKAIQYFFRVQNLDQLTVRHECKCGRCGRTLTHPESVDLGIGPECAQKFE